VHRIIAAAFAAGLLTAAVAVTVLLWPLHANGVTGSALMPHYSEYFGFMTTRPIPDPATNDDLRRAGVRLPIDVVWHRRHIAIGLLGGAAALGAAGATGLIVGRRRRQPAE
jgi:hypothetical protein